MLRTILLASLAAAPVAADCSGDLVVYWETRPPGRNVFYDVVEELRIDTRMDRLTVCGAEAPPVPADYARDDLSISFSRDGKRFTVYDNADGTFLSPPWTAEHDGALAEFRLRAIP